MEVRITKSMLQCSEAGDDDCLASPPACGQVVPAIVRSPIRVSRGHLPPWPAGIPVQLVQLACSNRTPGTRSEEHTSELQSLMRISYAVFCLKKKNTSTYLFTFFFSMFF